MNNLEQTNEAKDFMAVSFEDGKLSKTAELNDTMSIQETGKDDYESTLHSLGGKE